MPVVTYENNNSGGNWWLTTQDYERLEEAGWNVHWVQPNSGVFGIGRHMDTYENPMLKQERHGPEVKYLGCHAKSCAKEFENPANAIKEWEEITRQNASDVGCNCCGPPHEFEYKDAEGNTHTAYARVVQTAIGFDLDD